VKPPPDEKLGAVGVVKRLSRSGTRTLIVFSVLLIALAVICVEIQDRFGSTWGGIVGILVVPLIVASFMRKNETGRTNPHG
jgi:NADH:ubiquinone oxidoreductase subunit K